MRHKKKTRPFLESPEWKEARKKSLDRDGHACFVCGTKDGLVTHHILPRRYYARLRLEPNNLITLCRSCHWKVHKSGLGLALYDKIRRTRRRQYHWLIAHV